MPADAASQYSSTYSHRWHNRTRRKAADSPHRTGSTIDVPSRLPIIPLVSSVLFPGGVLSLQVGIDRNVRLLKSLPDDQNLIAAFCQKSGDKENPRARGSLADRRARGDRAAAAALVRPLPALPAGAPARRARADAAERAVLRGQAARGRAAADPEERQDRAAHEQGACRSSRSWSRATRSTRTSC